MKGWMGLLRYMTFGVCFSSDIPLGLPKAPIGESPRFELSALSGSWPASRAGQVVQEDGDDWMALRVYANDFVEIEWKGWLSFWIDPRGSTVRYRVNEERYPTAFEAYVANFATSACLLLQGEELLHSTVVYHRGIGIGFLGQSGAGKSTITAYLLNLGWQLVTDDMLRLTEQQGRLYAEPGPARLKLFEEAARAHLPTSVSRGRWNPVSNKYLFDIGSPTIARPSRPLDALILLVLPPEGGEEAIKLRHLEGLEAFQTLTSSTMNYRLQTADRLARQFAFASHLVKRLPVYALHYPRRHDVFPDVVQVLEDTVVSQCQTN